MSWAAHRDPRVLTASTTATSTATTTPATTPQDDSTAVRLTPVDPLVTVLRTDQARLAALEAEIGQLSRLQATIVAGAGSSVAGTATRAAAPAGSGSSRPSAPTPAPAAPAAAAPAVHATTHAS
ncbi:MAG: hypothetical protein ACYCYA_12755 [Actinomycetes bacterium]